MSLPQNLLDWKKWARNVARRLGILEAEGIKGYIISSPKSGRTWLRVLLGKALCDRFGIDEKWLLSTDLLTQKAGIIPTRFTHDFSDTGKSWTQLETDKSPYRGQKVVFLVRNPKDLIVSSYFHHTNRKKKFNGTISEFIRSDRYGIKKIMAFYKIWFENQTLPSEFLLLRYENMHENAASCLRSLIDFIGVPDIPENVVANAVEFSSFENMKKMEMSNYFQMTMMKPADPANESSYKVRRGKVGGYVDYLSEEDVEFIDRIVSEMGHPFVKSYY